MQLASLQAGDGKGVFQLETSTSILQYLVELKNGACYNLLNKLKSGAHRRRICLETVHIFKLQMRNI